jgi:hypothetical protein
MIGVTGVDKDLLDLFVPVIYVVPHLLTAFGYGSTPRWTRVAVAE